MEKIKYTYWEDDGDFLGYLNEYPDYMTQGCSLEDLKEHLLDLLKDINSGEIPGIRRVAELEIA